MNSVGPDGLTTFISLDESQQILILAQLMYGYGYVTTFAFEYEKTALECGLHDYEQVCIFYVGFNAILTTIIHISK